MGSISVFNDFSAFCKNVEISDSTIENIRLRYKAITKRINQEYWSSSSDSSHSLYVGSYGRGTCIRTSDIDIVVELPWSEFSRYDDYSGNGQSALLASVRNKLLKTYSCSKVSADGQVVDINFSDGVKFEIVPAFAFSSDSGYYYPDTNNGGSWRSMNPKKEIDSFNARNSICNGNLKRLCRMARAWNNNCTVLLDGMTIDTVAFHFLNSYEYADKGFTYYDWLSRDFFKYLIDNSSKNEWEKPGNTGCTRNKYPFKRDAEEAYAKCLEALSDFSHDYTYCWHEDWRSIYGTNFPKS